MFRNKAVLEAINRELKSRNLTITEWEDQIGWPPGTIEASLQPPDEISINRNIKLSAEHMGIDGVDFFEMVKQIDHELP